MEMEAGRSQVSAQLGCIPKFFSNFFSLLSFFILFIYFLLGLFIYVLGFFSNFYNLIYLF